VLENWTRLKNKEKKRGTFYDKIPKTLPALFYSYLIFKERDKIGGAEKKDLRELKSLLRKQFDVFVKSGKEKDLADFIFILTEWCALSRINPELLMIKKAHKEAKSIRYGDID
jgi:uncharacterized protein YabN with tetrapyrrole methylase and pyrophosphatase domain